MRISVRAWGAMGVFVAIVMVLSEVAVGMPAAAPHGISPRTVDVPAVKPSQPLAAALPEFPNNLTHFVLVLKENHVFDDYLGDCSLNINDTCNGGKAYNSTSSGTSTETAPSGHQTLTPYLHNLAREYAVLDNLYSGVDPYSAQGHNFLFTANTWGGTDSCASGGTEGTGSTTEWGIYNNSNVKSGSCGFGADLGSQTYDTTGGSIFDRFLGPDVPQSKTTLPFMADGDNVWELASPGCSVTASKSIPGDSLNSVQVVTGCTNGYWYNTSSGSASMPPTINTATGVPQFLWECQFASGCGSTAPSTFLDSYAANSFTAFLADYGLPTYTEVELQDDHPGSYCGQPDPVCIQWNDAATNTVVSAILNSSTYKTNTVIVITEDDTQDGANGMDHVNSGRRLPFVVVAPHTVLKSGGAPSTCGIASTYPSCGYVVHQTFNFSNVLAIMERVEMNVDPNVFYTGGVAPTSAQFPMIQNDYLAEGNPIEPLWKCGEPGVPCNTGASSGTAPTISAFTVSPSSIPAGGTTYLNVTATGGVGPLTYVYTGLPSPCASSNASSITCAPSAAGGPYTITVTVHDSASTPHTVTATATLTVTSSGGSGPTISAFTASPAIIPSGGTTYLNVSASGGVGPLTYAYTGQPGTCPSVNATQLVCSTTVTSTTTYTVTVTVSDSASTPHTATKTTTFTVNAPAGSGPTINSFTASPTTIPWGGTTYLNVTASGGATPYTYAYHSLPAGCTSANVTSLTCSPSSAGTSSVTVTVTGANGLATTSSAVTFTVYTLPAITSFTASPATIPSGGTTFLNVTAAGGTGSLSYAYAGLPSDCATANTAALTCTSAVAGPYTVTVTVTDQASHTATDVASFTVEPASTRNPPTIAAFTASPGTIPQGGTVYLNVTATGGTSPYQYLYQGLPPGCGSLNTANLVCTPTASGTYSVAVTVTDAKGLTAQSSTTFTVTAASSSQGSGSGLDLVGYALIAGIVILGVVLVVVLATRRKPPATQIPSWVPPQPHPGSPGAPPR